MVTDFLSRVQGWGVGGGGKKKVRIFCIVFIQSEQINACPDTTTVLDVMTTGRYIR